MPASRSADNGVSEPVSYDELINVPLASVTTPAEDAAALRLIVGRIARKLRAAKNVVGGLALSESSVLARLESDGPASPSALAEQEGVRPQAMAVTLAALEERGLVSREPHAADRRRAVIAMTAAGRKMAADRRSVSGQRLATAIEEEFSQAERRELQQLMTLLDRLSERL